MRFSRHGAASLEESLIGFGTFHGFSPDKQNTGGVRAADVQTIDEHTLAEEAVPRGLAVARVASECRLRCRVRLPETSAQSPNGCVVAQLERSGVAPRDVVSFAELFFGSLDE